MIPKSRGADLARVPPGRTDAQRIAEYLSFHANAVGGTRVTTVLSGQALRSASN